MKADTVPCEGDKRRIPVNIWTFFPHSVHPGNYIVVEPVDNMAKEAIYNFQRITKKFMTMWVMNRVRELSRSTKCNLLTIQLS